MVKKKLTKGLNSKQTGEIILTNLSTAKTIISSSPTLTTNTIANSLGQKKNFLTKNWSFKSKIFSNFRKFNKSK